MKIYTKTGDRGETGLVGSRRISKASAAIEAIGSVDELNSLIGVICSEQLDDDLMAWFEMVQHDLFDLGAVLASTPEQRKKYSIAPLPDTRIEELENQIDSLQESLPPIRQFILPSGNRAAALTHFARSVSRRAERAIIEFSELEETSIPPTVLSYINRLSDWLFVVARSINHRRDQPELFWKKQSH